MAFFNPGNVNASSLPLLMSTFPRETLMSVFACDCSGPWAGPGAAEECLRQHSYFWGYFKVYESM